MLNTINELLRRHLYFLLFVLVSVFFFWRPLRQLISFSLAHDYGSHILLIAPASAYLIYLNRQRIFSAVRTDFVASLGLFLLSVALWCIVYFVAPENCSYALEVLSIITFWLAGFALCYGSQAFRTAWAPLLFLLFMVPIPSFLLDKVIHLLQAGSTAVAYRIFWALNIPVFRKGFVILLPRLEIEVARECSGIRSSLALLITVGFVGICVLRSGWKRLLLLVAVVPILVLKNGIRIVTVSLLAIYVDRGFLHGWLHTSGGILFYLLGLIIFIPIIIAMRKSESGAQHQSDKGLLREDEWCQSGWVTRELK